MAVLIENKSKKKNVVACTKLVQLLIELGTHYTDKTVVFRINV